MRATRGALVLLFVAASVASCDTGPGSDSVVPTLPNPDLSHHDESIRARIESLRTESQNAIDEGAADATVATRIGQLGKNYHAHELFAAALECYRSANDLDPDSMTWIYLVASAHRDRGDLDLAVEWYRNSIAREDSIPARLNLASAQLSLGNVDDARVHIERVLARSARSARAHYLLGRVELDHGDPAKAVASFQRVLSIQPGATAVYYPLAMALKRTGKSTEARSLFARVGQSQVTFVDPIMEDVRSLRLGAHSKQNEGLDLIRAGRVPEGLEKLREATVEEPTDPVLWVTYGTQLARHGQREPGRAALYKALDLDPDNHQAHLSLGSQFAAEKRWPEALKHTRAAMEAAPSSRRACHNLAMLLERVGETDEALKLYRRTIELDPGRNTTRQQEVELLLTTKRWAVALTSLEEGVRVCRKDPYFLRKRVEVLSACPEESLRDAGRALDLARDAVTRFPGPETDRVLAMAHAENGELEEAIRVARRAMALARKNGDRVWVRIRSELESYEQGHPVRFSD